MIRLRHLRDAILKKASATSHGARGVRWLGHRSYVGGRWDEVGKLQFDFLVGRGLTPQHRLLDIGCGSLRAGVHLIPFLNAGQYMGIEKERDLVAAGIERELGMELLFAKRPTLIISDDFGFELANFRPTHALAHSVFTHLPASTVAECFSKLHRVLDPEGVFFATFFEAARPVLNPNTAHDHRMFAYSRAEIMDFGARSGWTAARCRDWQHPRGQVMFEYRPC